VSLSPTEPSGKNIMNNGYLLLGLLPVLSVSTVAFAAGFDCTKATSSVEKMICSDDKIDAADTELSSLYGKSKRSLPPSEIPNFKAEQRAWLVIRDKRCTTLHACLSVYQERIGVLKIKASWKEDRSTISPRALYERFNMRTIKSSYGPRLNYHCNTFPFEYFSESQAKIEGKNILILDNGGDFWLFKILPGNKVSITNQIISGTYLSQIEYELKYDSTSSEWKAKEANLARAPDCVFYNLEAKS